jgi:hypothetical protein
LEASARGQASSQFCACGTIFVNSTPAIFIAIKLFPTFILKWWRPFDPAFTKFRRAGKLPDAFRVGAGRVFERRGRFIRRQEYFFVIVIVIVLFRLRPDHGRNYGGQARFRSHRTRKASD